MALEYLDLREVATAELRHLYELAVLAEQWDDAEELRAELDRREAKAARLA